MNPQIFGIEHILYLVVFLALSVIALILINKYCRSDRSQKLVIIISALLLLGGILWNRITLGYLYGWIHLLPVSFCGFTSFFFALAVLVIKDKNHPIFHCLVYVALIGGIITMVYPDFIGQDPTIFSMRTLSGLFHHSMSIFVTIIVIMVGGFRPDLKKWYALPLGLCVYMTSGLFFIAVFRHEDAMSINHPLVPGMTWYLTGIIVVVVQFLFVLFYTLITNKVKILRKI